MNHIADLILLLNETVHWHLGQFYYVLKKNNFAFTPISMFELGVCLNFKITYCQKSHLKMLLWSGIGPHDRSLGNTKACRFSEQENSTWILTLCLPTKHHQDSALIQKSDIYRMFKTKSVFAFWVNNMLMIIAIFY